MDRTVFKKKILIACSMIEDEINAVFDRFDVGDVEIWWQERGHHNDPDKLRIVIQNKIEEAEAAGADLVMLAYGLCGNGAIGWRTGSAVLAMPRFDDCINIMLCPEKRDRRNYEEPGNMYITKGWIRNEGALLSMLERSISRHGERRGRRAMKLMFDSYRKVTMIDTGCYDLRPVCEYADKCREETGLEPCVVPGSNLVLEKLITCRWDGDILVKKPGERVAGADFEF